MFGFLYKGIVNDDAVTLRNLVNKSIKKYSGLSPSDIRRAVAVDFVEPYKLIDEHQVFFTYEELPEFDIGYTRLKDDAEFQELSVIGKGKYTGFQLHAQSESDMNCWAISGAAYRVSGAAKSLAKTMERKYGVDDFSRDMKQLYRQ